MAGNVVSCSIERRSGENATNIALSTPIPERQESSPRQDFGAGRPSRQLTTLPAELVGAEDAVAVRVEELPELEEVLLPDARARRSVKRRAQLRAA